MSRRAQASAREIPPAIHWHEGLLLVPQHFQSTARRTESLLHYHASAISPFHWGITRLEIDRDQLLDGVFRVVDLEAVMPDGLLVSYAGGDGGELRIEIASAVEKLLAQPMKIYLAVAARARTAAERYTAAEGEALCDENSGDCQVAVSILRPALKLFFGDEPGSNYVFFPLAEVAFRNDVFTLTNYQPPALRIWPGSALHGIGVQVATRLREKALFLAERARTPSPSAGAAQLLETRALIHALVGELPLLEALLRAGVSHPYTVYLALCSILGHAAGIGTSLVPAVLEPYDHNDPFAAFERAQSAIERALDEGIHEDYTTYPFFLQRNGEYHLPFDPAWPSRRLVLGVRAPSGLTDLDMASWIGSSVIGGESKIVSLRDRRVRGMKRERIEADAELVPSRGVTLYSIVPEPDLVGPGEALVIVNPGDPGRRPMDIVLYVRNPT